MNTPYDPLWNPDEPGDDTLREYERLLAPYGARHRPTLAQPPAPRARRRWRAPAWAFAVAASVAALIAVFYQYRLSWPTDRAWDVQWQTRDATAHAETLAPGQALVTAEDERARLRVARIGRVDVAPSTSLRLIETRAGRHRLALDHGEVRARIWAPPGVFGIDSEGQRTIDLGCAFTLRRDAQGRGQLIVDSGWVQQLIGARDVLVPAGHAIAFDRERIGSPLRVDATPAFRAAVQALDQAIADDDAAAIDAAAREVARIARDEDRYTLMSLLLRYRELARGELYPRLAQALGTRGDDADHRARFIAGEGAAIDAWWRLLPTQPKRWWANWRDAF